MCTLYIRYILFFPPEGIYFYIKKEHNRDEGTPTSYTLKYKTIFPSGLNYLRSQAEHSIIFEVFSP